MSEYLLIGIYILAGGVALSHLLCPPPNPVVIAMSAVRDLPDMLSAASCAAVASAQAEECRAGWPA